MTMLVFGLVACGGGGGSSSADQSTIAVSFNPTSVVATFPENGQSLSITEAVVTVTVTNLPTTPVYPLVIDSAGVLYPSAVAVSQTSPTTFTATLPFNALSAGMYNGNLMLELCSDSHCASQYAVSGGTLPYALTVIPGIKLTAQVNGIATALTNVPGILNQPSLVIHSGDTVTIQTSLPVQWTSAEGDAYAASVAFDSNDWSGSITSSHSGCYLLTATTINPPQAQVPLNI